MCYDNLMNNIDLITVDASNWTKIEGFSSKGLRVKDWYERVSNKDVFLYKEPKIYRYNNGDFYTKEIWTELIAYKIGTFIGLTIPEAIPAKLNSDSFLDQSFKTKLSQPEGRYGILIKNFLKRGHAGMPVNELIEAKEILSKTDLSKPHNLLSIRLLLTTVGIDDSAWNEYLKMLVFDALIGNNDRHDENWGFLYDRKKHMFKLSPIYDNASCLTSGETEERVNILLQDNNCLEKYVMKSKPPNLYITPFTNRHFTHFELLEYLLPDNPQIKDFIEDFLTRDFLCYTEEVVEKIQQLDVPNYHRLSDNRKELILKILQLRKTKLKDLVNVHY